VPTIDEITEDPVGTVNISVTMPNDGNVEGVEVFAGPDSDVNNASALGGFRYAAQNETVIFQETGVGTSVTRWYFARTRINAEIAPSAWTGGSDFTTAS